MVNSPLIRPYFLGGVALGGGTLGSHDCKGVAWIPIMINAGQRYTHKKNIIIDVRELQSILALHHGQAFSWECKDPMRHQEINKPLTKPY